MPLTKAKPNHRIEINGRSVYLIRDVAEELGVSESTIHQWIRGSEQRRMEFEMGSDVIRLDRKKPFITEEGLEKAKQYLQRR